MEALRVKLTRGLQCSVVALYLALLGLNGVTSYNRHEFPPEFIFGASTSAYQVEGAAFEDGRKPSIFDTFAHSGHVAGNGDVASNHYHKYEEDVQLMVETGLDSYRFTISWSRLIPNGRGPINPKGLEFYNNLINELIRNGIQPHVTLMHFDVPQTLEDEYEGFLSSKIVEDFTAYADVCFREFGDRVLHWTTINEANMFAFGGYDAGNSPPCRCSFPFGFNCTRGNSTTEPYLVTHNILLAHASAARLYKEKYQDKQRGLIGFSLYTYSFIPFSNSTEDIMAAQRSYDFFVGWLMDPLTYGDYPHIMKKTAGTKMPNFTENESELLKGSSDFVGLNYYTVQMIKDDMEKLHSHPRDYVADTAALWISYNNSNPLAGEPYPNTPWGLQGVLEYFKHTYNNPPIFILENGQQTKYNTSVDDLVRVKYLKAHIGAVLKAIRNGSNTKGYFVWSFLDAFELLFGYNYSYGLYYVDRNDPDLARYAKLSQKWYSAFLKGENSSIAGRIYQHGNETANVLRTSPQDGDRVRFI